ncbi:unnamed protein product [Adineta steineri]|uniref:DUF4139 domain-containing protein n=3 Tax=Adineta steineri TaxID=433720 RepID=A0A813YCF9_9BILA|nr:unnamed protein product [Adineta steineri]CAF4023976.1 unnamed protein product [Adineta steineri]
MATTSNNTPAHASHAYLFKNGYGMIVKTFEFPSNNKTNGQCIELMDPPSNPVHGTFWIQSLSNKTSITSIRTKKTKKNVDKECFSVEDLVEANVGENVEILVADDVRQTKEWITGKIKSVKRFQELSDDEDTNPAMPSGPVVHSFPGHHTISSRPPPSLFHSSHNKSGDLVLFETADNGLLGLTLTSIKSIRGATLKTTYPHKISKNCLSIDYKNDSGSNDTGLMKYLTYGITWAPSYNLVLLNSNDPSTKRLRLSSKAVILNDIENMTVDNLFCIVGFPNISKFASVIDPIISGDDVKTFLNSLTQCETTHSRGHGHSIMSNSIMTQQMAMPPMSSNISIPDDTSQDVNVDDLHLYEFKNILLQKKERLMLPIFDIEIPYKDIYHCKINSLQSEYMHSGYGEKKPFEEVWHSVEFENITNFVLTTAPIVITKGEQEQQFIGQDTLTYTSKGLTAFVNLTKALDVQIQAEENVVNTNPKRFTFRRTNYQADTIEGKISVVNYKTETIVVVINLSLTGKITNHSVAPKKDVMKTNENTVNEQHDIRWEINVKPKQTLDITYNKIYNRSV